MLDETVPIVTANVSMPVINRAFARKECIAPEYSQAEVPGALCRSAYDRKSASDHVVVACDATSKDAPRNTNVAEMHHSTNNFIPRLASSNLVS